MRFAALPVWISIRRLTIGAIAADVALDCPDDRDKRPSLSRRTSIIVPITGARCLDGRGCRMIFGSARSHRVRTSSPQAGCNSGRRHVKRDRHPGSIDGHPGETHKAATIPPSLTSEFDEPLPEQVLQGSLQCLLGRPALRLHQPKGCGLVTIVEPGELRTEVQKECLCSHR